MGCFAARGWIPGGFPRFRSGHCEAVPLVAVPTHVSVRCRQVVEWRSQLAPPYRAAGPLPDAAVTHATGLVLLPTAWLVSTAISGVRVLVELVVPLFVLAPRRIRLFAGLAITVLQLLIFLTGNYAFFNPLTIALCLFVLDDAALNHVLPKRLLARVRSQIHSSSRTVWRSGACGLVAAFILFVTGFEMVGELSGYHWAPAESVIRAVGPFEIANTYGLFAVMTTTRPEIIVEGSNDGTTWLPYEFRYKPGDLTRAPIWVQPHQPRLDWQMWFAALGNYQSDPWILNFLTRLLEGQPEVLRLLGQNPFPGAPPRYVRALVYDYRFATPRQRRASGDWWKREFRGSYVPQVSLRPR